MSAESVKVGAAQYAPALGGVADNMARSVSWMEQASSQGVQLLVLPECCLTGYFFDSRADLMPIGEDIAGDRISLWCDVCARLGQTLVAGLVEREGDTLFDIALVITPQRKVERYRKIHLWGIERDLYQAGDSPVVVQTPIGRIGLSICYDLWFPELSRALTLAGADLLASPANWAGNPRMNNMLDADGRSMGYHLARATACVNERPVVIADRIGLEGDLRFLGNSCIVSATGEVVAGPADDQTEMLLVSNVDIGPADATRQSHLQSRRPDVYAQPLPEVAS